MITWLGLTNFGYGDVAENMLDILFFPAFLANTDFCEFIISIYRDYFLL
jgi:hypothetical protein